MPATTPTTPTILPITTPNPLTTTTLSYSSVSPLHPGTTPATPTTTTGYHHPLPPSGYHSHYPTRHSNYHYHKHYLYRYNHPLSPYGYLHTSSPPLDTPCHYHYHYHYRYHRYHLPFPQYCYQAYIHTTLSHPSCRLLSPPPTLPCLPPMQCCYPLPSVEIVPGSRSRKGAF